ncbi:hypothetical protein VP01_11g5 [Puccinia sorghi]|uniref:Uncharacterized protein n=1 Tax=Puccinia sorghi TaxID=27349 RepID=A0A0L6VQR5_9BASI|nr:hypothetical protein VP01_11g5 [Puccinia sorghi]
MTNTQEHATVSARFTKPHKQLTPEQKHILEEARAQVEERCQADPAWHAERAWLLGTNDPDGVINHGFLRALVIRGKRIDIPHLFRIIEKGVQRRRKEAIERNQPPQSLEPQATILDPVPQSTRQPLPLPYQDLCKPASPSTRSTSKVPPSSTGGSQVSALRSEPVSPTSISIKLPTVVQDEGQANPGPAEIDGNFLLWAPKEGSNPHTRTPICEDEINQLPPLLTKPFMKLYFTYHCIDAFLQLFKHHNRPLPPSLLSERLRYKLALDQPWEIQTAKFIDGRRTYLESKKNKFPADPGLKTFVVPFVDMGHANQKATQVRERALVQAQIIFLSRFDDSPNLSRLPSLALLSPSPSTAELANTEGPSHSGEPSSTEEPSNTGELVNIGKPSNPGESSNTGGTSATAKPLVSADQQTIHGSEPSAAFDATPAKQSTTPTLDSTATQQTPAVCESMAAPVSTFASESPAFTASPTKQSIVAVESIGTNNSTVAKKITPADHLPVSPRSNRLDSVYTAGLQDDGPGLGNQVEGHSQSPLSPTASLVPPSSIPTARDLINCASVSQGCVRAICPSMSNEPVNRPSQLPSLNIPTSNGPLDCSKSSDTQASPTSAATTAQPADLHTPMVHRGSITTSVLMADNSPPADLPPDPDRHSHSPSSSSSPTARSHPLSSLSQSHLPSQQQQLYRENYQQLQQLPTQQNYQRPSQSLTINTSLATLPDARRAIHPPISGTAVTSITTRPQNHLPASPSSATLPPEISSSVQMTELQLQARQSGELAYLERQYMEYMRVMNQQFSHVMRSECEPSQRQHTQQVYTSRVMLVRDRYNQMMRQTIAKHHAETESYHNRLSVLHPRLSLIVPPHPAGTLGRLPQAASHPVRAIQSNALPPTTITTGLTHLTSREDDGLGMRGTSRERKRTFSSTSVATPQSSGETIPGAPTSSQKRHRGSHAHMSKLLESRTPSSSSSIPPFPPPIPRAICPPPSPADQLAPQNPPSAESDLLSPPASVAPEPADHHGSSIVGPNAESIEEKDDQRLKIPAASPSSLLAPVIAGSGTLAGPVMDESAVELAQSAQDDRAEKEGLHGPHEQATTGRGRDVHLVPASLSLQPTVSCITLPAFSRWPSSEPLQHRRS